MRCPINQRNMEKFLELLQASINDFYKYDRELIDTNVGMERACVFRIGCHLNNMLQKDKVLSAWDLDSEYNRNENGAKITRNWPNGCSPDLLLHGRGTNDHNFVVMEFKREENRFDREECPDYRKLMDFTSLDDRYKYPLGIFITLGRSDYSMIFFQKGRRLDNSRKPHIENIRA